MARFIKWMSLDVNLLGNNEVNKNDYEFKMMCYRIVVLPKKEIYKLCPMVFYLHCLYRLTI